MTDEQRASETARLQQLKDDGLIFNFEIREDDVLVVMRGYVGQIEVATGGAGRIALFTHQMT